MNESKDQQTTKYVSGRCRVCRETFVYMTPYEYERAVTRHILSSHRDEPPDKILVVPF